MYYKKDDYTFHDEYLLTFDKKMISTTSVICIKLLEIIMDILIFRILDKSSVFNNFLFLIIKLEHKLIIISYV